jgi:peptidoglycan-associated lipoprotein
VIEIAGVSFWVRHQRQHVALPVHQARATQRRAVRRGGCVDDAVRVCVDECQVFAVEYFAQMLVGGGEPPLTVRYPGRYEHLLFERGRNRAPRRMHSKLQVNVTANEMRCGRVAREGRGGAADRPGAGNQTCLENDLGTVAKTQHANGTRQVFPANTTTYTLTARGAGGAVTRSATVTVTAPPAPPPPPPKAPVISGGELLSREAQDAYFDYDKSDLRDDARKALTSDADLLKRIFQTDPNFRVTIEGNCDERGSAEYNLGLGDRRASAAKDFLVQLGVPADRLTTISYGKERPVCTEATEDCYQRNRHDHLAPSQ